MGRVRIIYFGERLDLSTGYRVDLNKWDENKQRVKAAITNKLKSSANDINASLIKIESIIQDVFKLYEVKDIVPSLVILKEDINAKIKIQAPTNDVQNVEVGFFDSFNEFIKECAR